MIMKKLNEIDIGTMVQEEEDGTYSAVLMATNFESLEDAEPMTLLMAEAVYSYLEKKGISEISQTTEHLN